jgi:hypothetical protein
MNQSTGAASLARPQDRDRPAWGTVSITPAERLGRIAVGLAVIISGIVLLASAGPAVRVLRDGDRPSGVLLHRGNRWCAC